MSSIVVRFPNGNREFLYMEKLPPLGALIWHDHQRYRVARVFAHDGTRAVVTVESASDAALTA